MSEHPERWLSELYRASAREEPPRSLDAFILKEAARKDACGWLSKLMTWQTPLAAAAVIVIAVALVIAIRDDPMFAEQSTLRSNDAHSCQVHPRAGVAHGQGRGRDEACGDCRCEQIRTGAA